MLKLYNTLTKRIEEFRSLKSDFVRMYDCGPTVYFYAHIGNMWRYIVSDLLRRVLEYNGFKVKQVMNITDVGHLTEDDLAQDTGEDKIEVAAKKEKKTPQEIALIYTKAFFQDTKRLNILKPHIVPKATEHIQEMIKFIKILEKRGYAYRAGERYFVFDIAKFKNYGKLSGKKIEDLKVGARLEPIKEKKNPFDFALWIKDPKHLMHWESPWGRGYPGWHIECSAMSMKYLGETLDIHTGGEDNIFPHHENEIAQSEAATGKKFVRFWLHVRHNLVDGQKMSKSKGNFFILQDLIDKGYDPLAFRFLCLTCHYRSKLNFTFKALEAAEKGLKGLREIVGGLNKKKATQKLTENAERWREKFLAAINNDLKIPKALSLAFQMLKDKELNNAEKYKLILDFDRVFGLQLAAQAKVKVKIPKEVKELVTKREKLRKQNKWQEADQIRQQIVKLGFQIEDTSKGPKLKNTGLNF